MFVYDLKKGNHTELLFLWLLCDELLDTNQIKIIKFCDNSDFDVEIFTDLHSISFEIKDDIKSLQTGNICIEYAGRNNVNSGICKSKSEFYVFKSGNEFIIFRTSQLKKYCFSCNHKQASINNAAFFLINKEELLKNVKHYIIKIKKRYEFKRI